MQSNGSKGRKAYTHPGRRPAREEPEVPGPHRNFPSRHYDSFDSRGRDTIGGAIAQPRPSGGFPSAEAHPKSEGAQWIEYFSVEAGRTLKYNPMTGETCDATKFPEPIQTDTTGLSPGKASRLDPERARESTKRPTDVDTRVKATPDRGDNQPGRNGPAYSSDNPGAGVLIPSSLSASQIPSTMAIQSKSIPDPVTTMNEMDRPVTVRDMERCTQAIQASIREMGADFIKAIARLHQEEGGSEGDADDD